MITKLYTFELKEGYFKHKGDEVAYNKHHDPNIMFKSP